MFARVRPFLVTTLLGTIVVGTGCAADPSSIAVGKGARDARAARPQPPADMTLEAPSSTRAALDKETSTSVLWAPDGQPALRLTLDETQNRTERTKQDVDALVRAAFTQKVQALNDAAPSRSAKKASSERGAAEKSAARDYHLQATVELPVYERDRLTVVVRVVVSAFPGASIEGEFVPRFTQADTPHIDASAEDVLIKKAIEQAVDSFGKYIASR